MEWMVRLTSGDMRPGERQAFQVWLEADPAHRQAWQRLEAALRPAAAVREVSSVQATAARLALASPRRRRLLKGGLALVLMGGGSAWLANRSLPSDGWTADLATGTGERRTVPLADGSRLTLNAASAVDIAFTETERLVRLKAGECIVQVAPDAARPFAVATKHGEARALGTRYLVRQQQEKSLVVVLEHSVLVRSASGRQRILQEKQAAWVGRDGIEPVTDNLAPQAAWEDGILDVRNRPLAEVVAALRPYRAGFICLASDAAEIRVFGVFQLDDTDRILQALAETLPVEVRRYGPWLVTIEARR